MNSSEILATLQEIFRDVLDNDAIVLHPETTAKDIAEWDSLSHVSLIVSIEKQFKTKFSLAEVRKLKNVGDLCSLVQAHYKA